MLKIYIDESGSLTEANHHPGQHYFNVGMIIVRNDERFIKRHRQFIKQYKQDIIKQHQKSKYKNMFYKHGKFKELKGSSLDLDFKLKYLNYMHTKEEVDYAIIKVSNLDVDPRFFKNNAQSFNFIIKLALIELAKLKNYHVEDLHIDIDNQNIRFEKHELLEDYLTMELVLGEKVYNNIEVEYYESHKNIGVQAADILANTYFGTIGQNGKYREAIDQLIDDKKIILEFLYPQHK